VDLRSENRTDHFDAPDSLGVARHELVNEDLALDILGLDQAVSLAARRAIVSVQ
jgi:hypothetical protein